jgi:hypothetical protein
MRKENLFTCDMNFPNNTNDYSLILENNVLHNNKIPSSKRKKILICLIELIQNIFRHNIMYINGLSKSIIIICDSKNDKICLKINQEMRTRDVENMKNIINKINNNSIEELKYKYQNNLQNNTSDNLGNGLIISRLKSDDDIKITAENINEKIVGNEILQTKLTTITLTFNNI